MITRIDEDQLYEYKMHLIRNRGMYTSMSDFVLTSMKNQYKTDKQKKHENK